MKKLLLTPLSLCFSAFVFAGTVTAVTNNGDWSTGSTWNTGNVPTGGDVAVIPKDDTVILNKTVDDNNKNITVIDYGTLSFTGGSTQLKLGPLSQVAVYPGASVINGTGNGSHLIVIGGVQVYKGNQGDIVGPQYATSTTGSFVSFTPLPVKFVSFSIAAQSSGVQINWSTAQEVDVDHYEVERSADGRIWNSIQLLKAKGSATLQANYTCLDVQSLSGQEFYRIKEVEKSGASNYTSIKNIDLSGNTTNTLTIHPNGAGSAMLHFAKPMSGTFTVRLVGFSGQVVQQQALTNPSGDVVFLSSLHGLYIVQCTNGKDVQVARQMIL